MDANNDSGLAYVFFLFSLMGVTKWKTTANNNFPIFLIWGEMEDD